MMVTTTVVGGPPEIVKDRTRVMLTIDTSAPDRVLTEEEYAREMERAAELARVRIEPGADPRAAWANELVLPPLRAWGERVALFETAESSPRVWSVQHALSPLDKTTLSGPHRYVPCDVRRWRDHTHRAELMRRAREHAAIRPGVYQ